MDKYYKEKKDLQEGVKCYWEVDYVGLTEFEVISTTEEDFTMESTDRYNMRFDFTQETIDKLNERGKHLFFDRNSAFDFMYERDEARKNKVVDKYKGDLEGFSKWAIKRVYNECVSSEYGDEAVADAIEELVAIHFPDLEL